MQQQQQPAAVPKRAASDSELGSDDAAAVLMGFGALGRDPDSTADEATSPAHHRNHIGLTGHLENGHELQVRAPAASWQQRGSGAPVAFAGNLQARANNMSGVDALLPAAATLDTLGVQHRVVSMPEAPICTANAGQRMAAAAGQLQDAAGALERMQMQAQLSALSGRLAQSAQAGAPTAAQVSQLQGPALMSPRTPLAHPAAAAQAFVAQHMAAAAAQALAAQRMAAAAQTAPLPAAGDAAAGALLQATATVQDVLCIAQQQLPLVAYKCAESALRLLSKTRCRQHFATWEQLPAMYAADVTLLPALFVLTASTLSGYVQELQDGVRRGIQPHQHFTGWCQAMDLGLVPLLQLPAVAALLGPVNTPQLLLAIAAIQRSIMQQAPAVPQAAVRLSPAAQVAAAGPSEGAVPCAAGIAPASASSYKGAAGAGAGALAGQAAQVDETHKAMPALDTSDLAPCPTTEDVIQQLCSLAAVPEPPASLTPAAARAYREKAHAAAVAASRAVGLLCDLVDSTYNQPVLQAMQAAHKAAGAADHWGMPAGAGVPAPAQHAAVASVCPSEVPITELLTPAAIDRWLRQLELEAAVGTASSGWNLAAATVALNNLKIILGLEAVRTALGQDTMRLLHHVVRGSTVFGALMQAELSRAAAAAATTPLAPGAAQSTPPPPPATAAAAAAAATSQQTGVPGLQRSPLHAVSKPRKRTAAGAAVAAAVTAADYISTFHAVDQHAHEAQAEFNGSSKSSAAAWVQWQHLCLHQSTVCYARQSNWRLRVTTRCSGPMAQQGGALKGQLARQFFVASSMSPARSRSC